MLLAYRDLGLIESDPAQRGLRWLVANADCGGGWGGGTPQATVAGQPSVEETAVAVEALLSAHGDPSLRPIVEEGLQWLLSAVRENRHRDPSPIGFYFAKLWYHERVYPLAFTVAALGQAVQRFPPLPPATTDAASQPDA